MKEYYKRFIPCQDKKEFILFEKVSTDEIIPIYLTDNAYGYWYESIRDKSIISFSEYKEELIPITEEEVMLEML